MYSKYHKYADKNSHWTHKVFTKIYLMTDFPKLQSAKKEQGLCQKNMSNHRTKISTESNNWMLNHAKKIILRY